MKLLTILLVCSFFNMAAQRFQEVVQWETKTISNGLVFGIAPSVAIAQNVVVDFEKRNRNTRKYAINLSNVRYVYTTYQIRQGEDSCLDFLHLSEKAYKVISKEDIEALNIYQNQGVNKAVSYLQKQKKTNLKYTHNRILSLVEFIPYRIAEGAKKRIKLMEFSDKMMEISLKAN